MPERIQRKRTRGWRMPQNAVYVGRPGKWGNPFSWVDYPTHAQDGNGATYPVPIQERRALAVSCFQAELYGQRDVLLSYPTVEDIRRELAGFDLVCWCPLEQHCHADVLLAVARTAPRVGATPQQVY